MRLHRFTHADTKQHVYLAETLIFAWYSLGNKTIVVANGGASIPVTEPMDYITNKLEGESNEQSSEQTP